MCNTLNTGEIFSLNKSWETIGEYSLTQVTLHLIIHF